MRLLTYCLFIISCTHSFAAMPEQFRNGRVETQLDLTYYTTNENFDDSGEKQKNIADQSYTHIGALFGVNYHLPYQIALQGAAQFAYAESIGVSEDRTNSEINEVQIGIRKLFAWQYFRLVPEAGYALALNEISENQDEVLTSDAADRLHIGTWGIISVSKFKGYGYLGYIHRMEDLSALIDWKFGAKIRWRPVGLGVEIGGYSSITDDKYTDTPSTRQLVNLTVNGGSNRYNAVNPTLTEFRLNLSTYFWKTWGAGFGFATPIGGENTAAGTLVSAHLAWYFDTIQPGKSKGIRKTKKNRSAVKTGSNKQNNLDDEFEPVLEEYNEDLFENDED